MGINGLGPFLLEHAPNAFKFCCLEELRNNRLAIDANLYFKKMVSAIYGSYVKSMSDPSEEIKRSVIIKEMVKSLFHFYIKMSYYGITLVMVWDGTTLPEKRNCVDSRNREREENKIKWEVQLNIYKQIDPLLRTSKDVKDLKDAMLRLSCNLSREEKDFFMNLIKESGMPCIRAENDGEKLCAALAIEGFVNGVYSTDTDNYAFGTPRTYTEFSNHSDQKTINFTSLENILKDLNFTQSQFVDLCIIAGCDFNTKIKKVTALKGMKALREYRSFEEIEKNNIIKDIEKLNYKRCCEIFSYEPTEYLNDPSLISNLNFNQELFSKNIERIFDEYNFGKDLFDSIKRNVIFLNNPRNYVKELPPRLSRFSQNSSSRNQDLTEPKEVISRSSGKSLEEIKLKLRRIKLSENI